jgi:perosamine synthetase
MTSVLARSGGSPVRAGPYPRGPHIDRHEHDAVRRVLDSGVLSGFVGAPGPFFLGGPEVRALEDRWIDLGGYAGVVAVNSATSGLHSAVAALGLPPGSEVVVPPYTMSATVAAVRMAGLRPRFADIDGELFTLSGETVKAVIGSETAAVVVVHLFGQMAPMAGLRALCADHGLRLLEDAAQAPGATQDRSWPGRGSSGAIFSFNQNKTITCGEGGLVASDDDRVLERARLIRNHAESVVHVFEVDPADFIGWNYRMTELEAAVAIEQTAKMDMLTAWRVALARRLAARIDGVPGLIAPVVHPGNEHVYFTFALRFDPNVWGCNREAFVEALTAEGVPCSNGYVPPLYRLPLFDEHRRAPELDPRNFPVCEHLAQESLVLLHVCGWPATERDVDDVADAVDKCWEHRAEIRATGSG